jgi:hypothetical protein
MRENGFLSVPAQENICTGLKIFAHAGLPEAGHMVYSCRAVELPAEKARSQVLAGVPAEEWKLANWLPRWTELVSAARNQ